MAAPAFEQDAFLDSLLAELGPRESDTFTVSTVAQTEDLDTSPVQVQQVRLCKTHTFCQELC